MMKPIPFKLQFFHLVQVVERHARAGGRGPNAVKSQNITKPKNSNEPTRNRGLPPSLHGRNSQETQDAGATSLELSACHSMCVGQRAASRRQGGVFKVGTLLQVNNLN